MAGWLLRMPTLVRFLRGVPQVSVPLSDRPQGRMIAAHLALRWCGVPRFRLAQGVLHLPSDSASYLRGRRRQAVRTNVRRARERGIVCRHQTLPAWCPVDRPIHRPAPTEYWWATNRRGEVVGECWLTVDDRCALLHGLECSESGVRWLVHTAVVEWLCERGCPLLVTNSCDVPLLPAGQRYFQRLLGYSVARLCPEPAPEGATSPATLASGREEHLISSGVVRLRPRPAHRHR
jgi:hypothetical protein